MSVKQTFEDIRKIAEVALSADPDDADLLADMIEAETDLHGLLKWCDRKMKDELRIVNSLGPEIKDLTARKNRAVMREKKMRALVLSLLEAAQQPKVELDAVTFSQRNVAPKRIVIDVLKLAPEFMKYTPDMTAIKAADEMPEGVSMDNGGKTLTVKRT